MILRGAAALAPSSHRAMGILIDDAHPSHLRAGNTEDRHAATAEVQQEYDPPESDWARQWLTEAPLRLGHRRGRLDDRYDHFPRAVRHQHTGPLPPEPPGVRLELLLDLYRLCPAVAMYGVLQPSGRLARGSLWGPSQPPPGGWLVHRGHAAHRQHDPPLALLSVLRHPPGHLHDHLSGASSGRGRRLVQDTPGRGDGHPAGRAGPGNGAGYSPGLCAVHPLRSGMDILGTWPGGRCPPVSPAPA